ncbi:unnamed protein product [Microthlaspi erraticum]|uniref:Uncharacterized protein n=1 Tax=Microthlaspi erraticum TaxID=1685480 RepID=A0A6D2JGW0_9BRAS|nr:unnamed protein product [Microthlaspi erraticum]
MDFIKTSSLRALSELTFQRNWNGLIWMSRKGVITKRVKTVQTALSRNRGQAVQSGRTRNECSAVCQDQIHPSMPRPKFFTTRPSSSRVRITTREAMSGGRPRHAHSR